MKKSEVFYVLVFILIVAAAWQLALYEQPVRVQVSYSEEFKNQARETIDAIERMQIYRGTQPEFEAKKAMDQLQNLSHSVSENNAMAVIFNYYLTSRRMSNQAAFDKARADLQIIRMHF